MSGDPLIGQQFGNFRLVRRLGEGAMGTVYEATHVRIDHRAVVKVLYAEFAQDAEFASRFLNEAKAVNIIQHPGLVSIFDFGQREDGSLFIVMEYLRGRTLSELVRAAPRGLPMEQAVELMHQLALAIAAAHEKGVIHRDVKPSNIILVDDSLVAGSLRLKVLDFGIAKLSGQEPGSALPPSSSDNTGFGRMLGTPMYMAPEQYGAAAEVTGKADVFATGAVFFELCTGQPPFGDTSSFRVVSEPAPRVRSIRHSVSQSLDDLIASMLSEKAAMRPSMQQVIAMLSREKSPAPSAKRRSPWLVLGGLGIGVLVGSGVVVGLRLRSEPDPYPVYKEARSAALAHLQHQLRSTSEAQRQSAIVQLGRARETSVVNSLRALVRSESRGSSAWQSAVSALGELQDYPSRSTLRELLTPLSVVSKQRCDWVSADKASREQLVLGSSLLRLRDPSGVRSLSEYLRCYPQERPGFELDAALALSWQGEKESRVLSPAPWVTLRSQLSRLEDGLPALTQTMLTASESTQEEILRWLRSQDGLREGSSLQLKGVLARFGDGAAAETLEQLSQPSSPRKYEASEVLLLSRPGDPSLCATLREGLSVHRADSERLAFVSALALCPQLETVTLLSSLLRDEKVPLPVRDQVAGSLLRLLPSQSQRDSSVADELQSLCQSGLSTDQMRCLDALIEQQDASLSDWLRRQLHDESTEVRLAAVRGIGRARLLKELDGLRMALQDANTDVRLAGERALVEILDATGSAQTAVPTALRQKLEELAQSADLKVRVTAQVILLRLGDSHQSVLLQQTMKSADESLRKLLVEVIPLRHPILITALSDQSPVVRLFAAHRLAESGDRRAIPVLQEMLAGRGGQVLLAYMDLRRLGVNVARPPQLRALLSTRDLSIRFAAVQLLRYLSPKEAAPYLLQLAYDSSDVIRKEVLRVVAELYRAERLPMLRLTLERFLHDEALAVRLLARRLYEEAGLAPPASNKGASSHGSSAAKTRAAAADVMTGNPVDAGAVSSGTDLGFRAPVDAGSARPDVPSGTPSGTPSAAAPSFSQSLEQVRAALRTQNLGTARQLLQQLRKRPGLQDRERHDLDLTDTEISIADYQQSGQSPALLEQSARKLNGLFARSKSAGFGESHKKRLWTLQKAIQPSVVTVRSGVIQNGHCVELGVVLLPGVQQMDGKLWRGGSEVIKGCDPGKP